MSYVAYPAKDKLDAVDRELKLRKRVYPRLVEAGRLSAKMADDQIAIFEAIRADYLRLANSERLL